MKDLKLFLSQLRSSNMLKDRIIYPNLHDNLVNLGMLFFAGMGCAWTWGEIGNLSLLNV
jgi:hypothetical protein